MTGRKPIQTTIQQAVAYWETVISECDLSVDWSEAETHCWRCGCEKNLQRCHIVPDALGGKDVPENIVLLCARCHAEGPNVTDPAIMWDWIKAYKVTFYETFWYLQGLKEYEFLYKCPFVQEIQLVFDKASINFQSKQATDMLTKHVQTLSEKASVHFGQPYFNTATVAGLMRMMVKEIARELKVEVPIHD